MFDQYGSDYLSITDEDGTEYELEVLSTLEYNGYTYLAVLPAFGGEGGEAELAILKSIEEDGESLLVSIAEEQELDAVYERMMAQLYEEDED